MFTVVNWAQDQGRNWISRWDFHNWRHLGHTWTVRILKAQLYWNTLNPESSSFQELQDHFKLRHLRVSRVKGPLKEHWVLEHPFQPPDTRTTYRFGKFNLKTPPELQLPFYWIHVCRNLLQFQFEVWVNAKAALDTRLYSIVRGESFLCSRIST